MESRYAKDLKKAALAELEEAAASWRDTLEKYQLERVDDPCMGEICLPWQMDDYRDADVMADEIKSYPRDNIQMRRAFRHRHAEPRAGLVTRHGLGHGRHARQRL